MTFKITTNSTAGFTLIELLVVISIIGLLASIAMSALVRARESAQDQMLRQNVITVSKALDLFYQDNGYYPYFGNTPISSTQTVWKDGLGAALQPYLLTLPEAPNRLLISYLSTDASSITGMSIRISGPPGVQRICLRQNSYIIYARLYNALDNGSPSIWIDNLFALASGNYTVLNVPCS